MSDQRECLFREWRRLQDVQRELREEIAQVDAQATLLRAKLEHVYEQENAVRGKLAALDIHAGKGMESWNEST